MARVATTIVESGSRVIFLEIEAQLAEQQQNKRTRGKEGVKKEAE